MRAIAIDEFGGADKLRMRDFSKPEPGAEEVLIEVKAAGVNPVDWKVRNGYLQEMLPHEFPVILGWDAAGVVRQNGPGVSRFSEGDEVYAYCRKPTVHDGAYAEFIVLPESYVALKPQNQNFLEAASVPLACLTAYQSLFDKAELQEKESILIHAAAGGVGTFAVQLAKNRGATVLGTASKGHHDYLRALGVDIPIDYHARDIEDAVGSSYPDGVDVIFDLVGGEALKKSRKILADDGRVISVIDPEEVERMKAEGINAAFVFVEPNGEQLRQIAEMIEAGRLKTSISAIFDLEEAAEAHKQSEAGHTQGKIVLRV